MRAIAAVMATVLLASQPACTLVGLGVGSSVTATHNTFTDDMNDWHYTTPMLIGAGLGLIVDIGFLIMMSKEWSKPMN